MKMQQTGLFKKMWSDLLPFVARSPVMKVEWLVSVLGKGSLTDSEIAPYIHILLGEYQHNVKLNQKTGHNNGTNKMLPDLFTQIPRNTIVELLKCAEIYDIPLLLEVIKTISVDEAILVLNKIPPAYEKRPMQVYDLVFQAVHSCGGQLLSEAKMKMQASDSMPGHLNSVYERFQEILKDKEILSSIFPQAKASTFQLGHS